MNPRITVYRAARPRRWRLMFNRYRGVESRITPRNPEGAVTIGVALQLGSRVISLQCRQPSQPHPADADAGYDDWHGRG